MSEFKGMDQMDMPRDGTAPNWVKEWGQEARVERDGYLLELVYERTSARPMKERNDLLRVVKEELIPIRNRWRDAMYLEFEEAIELCQKFNKPETGVFHVIFKDYVEFLASLPARYPALMPIIEKHEEMGRIFHLCPVKTLHTPYKDEPVVVYRYGSGIPTDRLAFKSYEAMKDRLAKKATLQEEQNQVLARALEENGLQLPHEFTSLQRQLDELKQPSPQETAQAEEAGVKTGERQDPCPDAPFLGLVEHASGSVTGVFENLSQPYVHPPKPPLQIYSGRQRELLDTMETYECSRMFQKAPTEREAPGYFKIVKQHRDLVTIHSCVGKAGYGSREFFQDIRYMIDNYCHFFREGSRKYKRALEFEKAMLEELEPFGEAGQTAKTHFAEALRAEFNDTSPSPEDDEPRSASDDNAPLQQSEADDQNDKTFDPDDFDTSFAQDVNKGYESDYGDEHDHNFDAQDEVFDNQDGDGHEGRYVNESPGVRGPSEPSAGEDDTLARAFDQFDAAKQYDIKAGNATKAPVRHNTQYGGGSSMAQSLGPRPDAQEQDEQAGAEDSFFDQHDYANPDSDDMAALPHATSTEAGDDDTIDLTYHAPRSDGSTAPSEAAAGEPGEEATLPFSDFELHSDDPTAQPKAASGEAGEEDTHVGAHAFHQPASVAPMEAKVIDLTSSPQGPTSHTGSASAKRARASDDQDSSDDDRPFIRQRKRARKTPASQHAVASSPQGPTGHTGSASAKRARASDDEESSSDDNAPLAKRSKTAGKTHAPHYAPKPSLGKRSRDNGDAGDEEEQEQPSKRQRSSSPSAQEPPPPAHGAAVDRSRFSPERQALLGRTDIAQQQQAQQQQAQQQQAQQQQAVDFQALLLRDIQQQAELPPSPIPERFTPEAEAADGPVEPTSDGSDREAPESRQRSSPPSVAADEPATVALGHTDNGTTNPSKLQKLPKYKKKARSKGPGVPNRPWVFGHKFGDEYGLYIMSCPTKGCPADGCNHGPEVFSVHPLIGDRAALHLLECCGDNGGGDDDNMVRKYCKQVISDDNKAVSIEWARKWNEGLMEEYGHEDREGHNF